MRELESIVAALGLSNRVRVRASRAEALARTEPGRYAVVVTRALSELPALVELAAPLLEHGGELICMKGIPSFEELRRGEAAASIVGLRLDSDRQLELPEDVGRRRILVYRKVRQSDIHLPRREGAAQHSPLA